MTIHFASKWRWQWGFVGLVMVALAGSGARAEDGGEDGPANAATQRIHQESRRILNSITTTVYQHKTEIDEEQGDYRCDCSGLGGYILNRTVAKDAANGPLGDGRTRPRAVNFHDVFAEAPTEANGTGRWQRIERLTDARPGDIIAWRRVKLIRGRSSGHVVVVDQKPVLEEDGLVRVVMIDSTTKPQVDDTRAKGTGGIGRGTMWFTVDDEGRPVGTIRGSRTAEPKVEPISIGRALSVEAEAEEVEKNAA